MVRKYVGIILKDEQGRILFQLRDEKAERHPNYWAFFGGGIEEGELPETALRREIYEELGIKDLKDFKLFRIYKFEDSEEGSEEHHFFVINVEGPVSRLNLKLGEGRGMAFLSQREINQMKFVEYQKPILNDLFSL